MTSLGPDSKLGEGCVAEFGPSAARGSTKVAGLGFDLG